jgi:hypothetical protein
MDYLKQRLRQRMTRRRYASRGPKRQWGTTAKLALFVLAMILLVGAILELRSSGGEAELLEYAREDAVEPLGLIANGARSHRLVFLADVPGSTAPKHFAAAVIDTLAAASGVDVVALEVSSDEQPWIDRYLESKPEDASILLAHPGTLRENEGTANAFLDIYRRVWQLNQRLGPDRRIRILAIDDPGWPTGGSLSPGQAAVQFSRRDAHMYTAIRERILDRNAQARVLFFVDGLHTLKGAAQVGTGGTAPTPMNLLARIFEQNFPREVYSVLTDAPAGRAVNAEVASYRSTLMLDVFRGRSVNRFATFALPANERFDFMPEMIRTTDRPGITFQIVPSDYQLSELIDAYVFIAH